MCDQAFKIIQYVGNQDIAILLVYRNPIARVEHNGHRLAISANIEDL